MVTKSAMFAALVVCSWSAAADTITIRADEWLPYNGGTRLNPPGYMIEMAQAIAKDNGHEIDYRNMAWDDALAAARAGRIDCVVGAYISDAEGFAFPKASWGKSGNDFWVLADSKWRYEGVDSLASVRLAIAEGYSYGDEIDAWIKANRADPERIVVVPVIGRASARMIARLVGRQADVMVEDANVLAYALEQAKMEQGRIVSAGNSGAPEDVYIACTPAHPRGRQWADMFDAGTQSLRSSGRLKEILARYNLADWQN